MNIKKILKKFNTLNISKKLMIILGVFGLIPFFIGIIDIWINKQNFYFFINIPKYYGAIILTFLGGIYWGVALNLSNTKIINNKLTLFLISWSIIPSIFSFYALYTEQIVSVLILSLGFILALLIDEILNNYLNFSKWYLYLRRFLSIIVIIVLVSSYLILSE